MASMAGENPALASGEPPCQLPLQRGAKGLPGAGLLGTRIPKAADEDEF